MKAMSKASRPLVAIALALLMIGCSAHRTRVNCDGHLRPINPPAPVTPAGGTHS
jgi:hypothetical protein